MTNKLQRPRVLLVDDYPDAREMYSEYLEFSGFDVIEAGNGMEALQSGVENAPDIILMDLSPVSRNAPIRPAAMLSSPSRVCLRISCARFGRSSTRRRRPS